MPLGITSKLFLNGGTYDVPVWVTVDLISDNQVDAQWNKAESSVRAGRIETQEQTNLRLGITGKVRVDASNAGFLLLRTAFLAASILDVLVLNGPGDVNGSEGFRFDARVFNFGEDQGLQVTVFKDFELVPCMSVNVPKSAIVSGGSISYATIAP